MAKEILSLSIVIPILNEEENIMQLYTELKSTFDNLNMEYELLWVNDGSSDRSLEILKGLACKDSSAKVISFSKNFGQTAALMSAIVHAVGKIVIFIDGDLQNDPRDIPLLINKLQEGYDIVSGWRYKRKDALLSRRIPSFIANKLISLLSGVHLHDFGCTLKAFKSEFLKDINLYGEMHRFIPIYASWLGAKITEIPVNHRARKFGKSKYTIWRTLKVTLDLITIKFLSSYGTRPIYVFGGTGLTLFFLSFLCALMLIYNKLVHRISMIQSPLLLLSALLVIVGCQSTLMGLLAEMQIRTYYESLRKPIYHIKEKLNL